jgi:hypothetical protein
MQNGPMKIAACACAAVLVVLAVHAAGEQAASAYGNDVLVWSKDVKLSREHFKAKVPPATREAAYGWVGLDVSWECRDGKGSWYATAVFDPARSWWPPAIPGLSRGLGAGMSRAEIESRQTAVRRDDEDLLRHEQLHFDLTELAARKIRRQLDDLQRVCTTPGAAAGIGKAIDDIERHWLDEQTAYDKETDHGINLPRQRQWDLRVRRALQ